MRHCVGVANGLEAMQLVLMALGVGPGEEVIVPSHGYIATWLAVTHVGAKPVPCEPDPRTYNLDPERIAPLITPRTKVILPIHLYGQTADMSAINTVAKRHGLFVLEDAAQSHGTGRVVIERYESHGLDAARIRVRRRGGEHQRDEQALQSSSRNWRNARHAASFSAIGRV